MGEGLVANETVKSFDISKNQLDGDCCDDLLTLLQTSETLQVLDLSWNKIGSDEDGRAGMAALLGKALGSTSCVREINLDNCGLNDADMSIVAENWKAELDSQDSGAGKGGSLKTVSLKANQIGSTAAGKLAELLQCEGCNITELDLSYNQVGVAGSRMISGALQNNQSLAKLGLRCNGIGTLGGCNISQALLDNSVLQSLQIGANGMDSRAACALTVAQQQRQQEHPALQVSDYRTHRTKAPAAPSYEGHRHRTVLDVDSSRRHLAHSRFRLAFS